MNIKFYTSNQFHQQKTPINDKKKKKLYNFSVKPAQNTIKTIQQYDYHYINKEKPPYIKVVYQQYISYRINTTPNKLFGG